MTNASRPPSLPPAPPRSVQSRPPVDGPSPAGGVPEWSQIVPVSHKPARRRGVRVVVVLLVALAVGFGGWKVFEGAASGVEGATGGTSASASTPEKASSAASGNATPAPDTTTQATGLNPQIQHAFALAQADAKAQGVDMYINSGWRSAGDQEKIVQDYIRKYGSVEEAHKWALPPSESAHVQGNAIDVGPDQGAYWLSEHGADYGLCRTYANEAWHFELVIKPGGTCPPMHPDASWGWK